MRAWKQTQVVGPWQAFLWAGCVLWACGAVLAAGDFGSPDNPPMHQLSVDLIYRPPVLHWLRFQENGRQFDRRSQASSDRPETIGLQATWRRTRLFGFYELNARVERSSGWQIGGRGTDLTGTHEEAIAGLCLSDALGGSLDYLALHVAFDQWDAGPPGTGRGGPPSRFRCDGMHVALEPLALHWHYRLVDGNDSSPQVAAFGDITGQFGFGSIRGRSSHFIAGTWNGGIGCVCNRWTLRLGWSLGGWDNRTSAPEAIILQEGWVFGLFGRFEVRI